MLSPELDALIVENLGDLDAAAIRIQQIDEIVFDELGKSVEQWATDQGWQSSSDWNGDGIAVWPHEWANSEDEALVSLMISYGADDAEDDGKNYFNLTRLIGAGLGELGFRIELNVPKIGTWKKAHRSALKEPSLSALPRDDNGDFFFPFRIEQSALVQAIRDGAIEDAFEGVGATMDQLSALRPMLDRVVAPLFQVPKLNEPEELEVESPRVRTRIIRTN